MTDAQNGSGDDTEGNRPDPEVVRMWQKLYQLPGGDKDPFEDTVAKPNTSPYAFSLRQAFHAVLAGGLGAGAIISANLQHPKLAVAAAVLSFGNSLAAGLSVDFSRLHR